jgi:histidyl-tRNA synthetase
MVKGTRVLMGDEAEELTTALETMRQYLLVRGYREVIIPSLWEQQTFVDKAGKEILNQMYAFNDKGDRPICLIPEVTAIIQQLYKDSWSRSLPKPVKVFYSSRCYRYEQPQAGRYREFNQFGVELLGGKAPGDADEVKQILMDLLSEFTIDYTFSDIVKRGLDYYIEDGFEASCAKLGAQKQIAGGGRYETGIGFAIGVDRMLLARKQQ